MNKTQVWKNKKSYKYFSRKLNKVVSVKKHGQHYQMRINRAWTDIKPKDYGLVTRESANLLGWLDKKSLNELTKDLKERTPDDFKIYVTRMKRSKDLESLSKIYGDMTYSLYLKKDFVTNKDKNLYPELNDEYEKQMTKFLEAKIGELGASFKIRDKAKNLKKITESTNDPLVLIDKGKEWYEGVDKYEKVAMKADIHGFPIAIENFSSKVKNLLLDNASKNLSVDKDMIEKIANKRSSGDYVLQDLSRNEEQSKNLGIQLKNVDQKTKEIFTEKLFDVLSHVSWGTKEGNLINGITKELEAKLAAEKIIKLSGIKRRSLLLMTYDEVGKIIKEDEGEKLKKMVLEEIKAFPDYDKFKENWFDWAGYQIRGYFNPEYVITPEEMWKKAHKPKKPVKKK